MWRSLIDVTIPSFLPNRYTLETLCDIAWARAVPKLPGPIIAAFAISALPAEMFFDFLQIFFEVDFRAKVIPNVYWQKTDTAFNSQFYSSFKKISRCAFS